MSSAYFGDDDPVTETKTKETLKRKKTQGMYNFIITRKVHHLKISKRNTQTTTTPDFLGSTRRNGHGNVLRKMRMVV